MITQLDSHKFDVHLRRNTRPLFRCAVLVDIMSQSELTPGKVLHFNSNNKMDGNLNIENDSESVSFFSSALTSAKRFLSI